MHIASHVLQHTLKFNSLDLSLPCRLTLAEYHEQEEIFKLRLGHLKKVRTAEKAFRWVSDSVILQTGSFHCTDHSHYFAK